MGVIKCTCLSRAHTLVAHHTFIARNILVTPVTANADALQINVCVWHVICQFLAGFSKRVPKLAAIKKAVQEYFGV